MVKKGEILENVREGKTKCGEDNGTKKGEEERVQSEEERKGLNDRGMVEKNRRVEGREDASRDGSVEGACLPTTQKKSTFKKINRSKGKESNVGCTLIVGAKRSGDDMEVEEPPKIKKSRGTDVEMNEVSEAYNICEAGLSEQLRGAQ
jgi:hypothetical protein